jgi:hypothetical protein
VIAAALALVVSAAPPPGSDVYAIIVGYNGGHASEPALPALRYADDDALRFYRWFLTLAPADHLTLLTTLDDETKQAVPDAPPAVPPTRTALLAALHALEPKLTPSSKVFFLYAGHGLPGRFLLQPESGDDAAFTGAELRAAMAALPGQRALLFLDACRSQSLFSERGAPDFSADVQALEAKTAGKQLGILTAASSTQSAGESQSLGGGYFSHVLASGLAGAADADLDGTVRFGELAAFVAFHTERLFGQRPWFEAPGGDLRAPVVELTGLSGLRFDEALAGRLRVRDASTHRIVVELNKAPGTPAALGLPSGRYLVEREGQAAEVEVGESKTPVEARNFHEASVASRGGDEPDGFSAPFSSDVVSALSAGYHSATEAAQPSDWVHAVDLGYGLAPAPFGLPGIEHTVALGYRRAFSTNWLVMLHGAFRISPFASGALDRAGLMLEAALRFRPRWVLEVEPHLGVGLETLWRTGTPALHADFGAPQLAGGVRVELPIARGAIHLMLDANAALSFVPLDGQSNVVFSPQLLLGVAWKK